MMCGCDPVLCTSPVSQSIFRICYGTTDEEGEALFLGVDEEVFWGWRAVMATSHASMVGGVDHENDTMGRLGWVSTPSCLVKHDSGCFCEGVVL